MNITCPQCGAKIQLQPRSIQLFCPYCNTPLALEKEPSLETYKLEPTWDEKPIGELVKQFLAQKNRDNTITKQELIYLPFYRLLYELNGRITEKVFSALESPPFPLFSIPSGTLKPVEKDIGGKFLTPQKNLTVILDKIKKDKVKVVEEMLLLYLPFWRITISSNEIIWIDSVHGKILTQNIEEITNKKEKLVKLSLTGLFMLLFIEGIPPLAFPFRFILQCITSVIALYFIIKQFRK
ncbi:MAG: hypothetical protein B5M53_10805 [Candidatus Cloacimonas sp. 4484_209]|nr:MAG: hypothetical protein B5M53_10805 [Candidatus Cloacimonas sp. 4484_209]